MLDFVLEDIRRDRDIVMAAVAQNGQKVKFVSEDIWGDCDIFMASVNQVGL